MCEVLLESCLCYLIKRIPLLLTGSAADNVPGKAWSGVGTNASNSCQGLLGWVLCGLTMTWGLKSSGSSSVLSFTGLSLILWWQVFLGLRLRQGCGWSAKVWLHLCVTDAPWSCFSQRGGVAGSALLLGSFAIRWKCCWGEESCCFRLQLVQRVAHPVTKVQWDPHLIPSSSNIAWEGVKTNQRKMLRLVLLLLRSCGLW